MVYLYDLLFLIISNIRVPFKKTITLSEEVRTCLENSLKHGDLIFGHRDGYLKNILVPGPYQHVGAWNALRKRVVEMQEDGGNDSPLQAFYDRYTSIAVGRPNFTPEYAQYFMANLDAEASKPYDSSYSMNNKNVYCSESIARADAKGVLSYEPQKWFWFWVFMPSKLLTLPMVRMVCKIEVAKNGGIKWTNLN